MARLFIAIETPVGVAETLLRTLPAHRGIRPVPPGQLHLTLRFLGDQDEDAAARIDAALREVPAPAMSMALQGAGRFRGRQGAILWAGLAADPALATFFDDIQCRLATVGIAPERRQFRPHLTVARCRTTVPEGVLRDWLAACRDLSTPPWRVERFVLFESFLNQQGARHVQRAVYPMAALNRGC